MDLDADYVDEDFLFQPAPASVREAPRFQPKTFSKSVKPVKGHPKTWKPVKAPSKLPDVASQLVPPVLEASVHISDTMNTNEKPSLQIASTNDSLVDASGLDSTHGSSCQAEVFPSETLTSGGNVNTARSDHGEGEGVMDLNTDSLVDDCLLPSDPHIKEASNFRPKLITQPKERTVKKVSFSISDAVETVVHTVDTHISFTQSGGGEKLACNTTEAESSFIHMLCEGSLDETPDTKFTVPNCNEDVGMGHLNYEEEDISEILDLESLDKNPSQSTSKIGKFQPKLSTRIRNVKPNALLNTHGFIESEKDSRLLESESLEGLAPIIPPYSSFDSVTTCDSTPTDLILEQPYHVDKYARQVASQENNHLVGKEQTSDLSKDTNKEVHSHDIERAEQILNEKSTSKVVEDEGASKSTRKLRKRTRKSTPDKIHENQESDNSNIEVEGIQSDDGCGGKEAPKQKRARRTSKKTVTETEKPTRKREKASEELGSAEQEPVKKFPHGTRRRRRQVNKELLLMPEEEINRSQLCIRDLIRTYESKERISKKEVSAGGNSSFNQRDNHFGTNGEFWGQEDDFENFDVQLNVTTTKWNHHSFRKNPTSTSRWSKEETDLFYQALCQFGTNFEMIQKLFPGRTRHQMTLKFKNERRKYPLQIAGATTHPSKDFSLVKLVIQALADEEKEKAKKKVYYVNVNNDEDEYEEGNEQPEKEEAAANDLEGEFDKEEQEANEWEGGGDKEEQDVYESHNQFEFEDTQWDGNASYYQDTETDEFSFLL